MAKRSLINKAYESTNFFRGRLLRDNAWENLFECVDSLAAGTGAAVNLGSGIYKKSADGLTQWKEYSLEIIKDNVKVEGILTAHAAGTLAEPFSCYDLTMILW